MSYGVSYIEIEKGAVIFIVLSLSHVMHRRENSYIHLSRDTTERKKRKEQI
jgi:hypothetical protein